MTSTLTRGGYYVVWPQPNIYSSPLTATSPIPHSLHETSITGDIITRALIRTIHLQKTIPTPIDRLSAHNTHIIHGRHTSRVILANVVASARVYAVLELTNIGGHEIWAEILRFEVY